MIYTPKVEKTFRVYIIKLKYYLFSQVVGIRNSSIG